MATTPHPLAQATAVTHPWTDAVESSEREGQALDAAVDALRRLAPPIDRTTTLQISALAKAIVHAAAREGDGDLVANWARRQVGAIAEHARRLGVNPARRADMRAPESLAPHGEPAAGPTPFEAWRA